MKPVDEIAADFDVIAAALRAAPASERLTPAEHALLAYVPANARRALDVGCGDGVIARALARRGVEVLGIDISPRMIDLARSRTDRSLAVEYRQADVMTDDLPEGGFDVVVSVSMVHHLPLDVIVPRLARLVAPGGTLLLQDVAARRGFAQLPMNAVAMIVARVRRLIAPTRVTSHVATAYLAHGAGEEYLDATMVTSVYEPLLPGARIIQHLEWRYSVVWQSSAISCPVQPQ